ncbi:MAG: prephenate dehydrogenase/arogenate dehydrogenase family protein [Clostridia bacterium]|nr:prephenate dehydrogenase/arogenate dehydrogenase family protein [Clostridia bacterium]
MRIGIVGLGLIGGSLAKALTRYTDHEVYGENRTLATAERALADGSIHGIGGIDQCDVVYVCLPPQATVDYIRSGSFRDGAVVTDVCGIKRFVLDSLDDVRRSGSIRFVGSHPMAGREVGGYESSLADLYKGASYIITQDELTDSAALAVLEDLARQMHFGRVQIATPEEHDRIIAYTSQMAHVVSNAYIKNKAALEEIGFSAGSFKDLTRVAQLDAGLWTELMIENRDMLTENLDEFMGHLKAARDAIAAGDSLELHDLLQAGSERRIRLRQTEERS